MSHLKCPRCEYHIPLKEQTPARVVELSRRRVEIAALAVCGRSYADIAETLQTTRDAVKQHMREICMRCGAETRAMLTVLVLRGIVELKEKRL